MKALRNNYINKHDLDVYNDFSSFGVRVKFEAEDASIANCFNEKYDSFDEYDVISQIKTENSVVVTLWGKSSGFRPVLVNLVYQFSEITKEYMVKAVVQIV